MSKEAKKIVSTLLGKSHKILGIFVVISLILYVCSPIVAVNTGNNMIFIFCGISGVAFFVMVAIYFSKKGATKKSVKTLARTNKLGYADEILSGDYNSNGKVGFSKHLFYDQKTKIIIAYDDILWVYTYVGQGYNIEAMFCTVDGKRHRSLIDELTLAEFIRRRDGILFGNTPENKTKYNEKVKEFKGKNK